MIVSYLISLLQFVSDLFKQLSVLLLTGNKEVKRIDTQSNDGENQENDEVTKTCGHEPVPLSFE